MLIYRNEVYKLLAFIRCQWPDYSLEAVETILSDAQEKINKQNDDYTKIKHLLPSDLEVTVELDRRREEDAERVKTLEALERNKQEKLRLQKALEEDE